MVTPILAPTLFALFFRKLGVQAIWITVGICFPLGLIGRFVPYLQDTLIGNTTFTGVILPVLIVAIIAMVARKEAPGWSAIEKSRKLAEEAPVLQPNTMPALIVSISLGLCAVTLFGLIFVNDRSQGLLLGFGIVLSVLSLGMYGIYRKMKA